MLIRAVANSAAAGMAALNCLLDAGLDLDEETTNTVLEIVPPIISECSETFSTASEDGVLDHYLPYQAFLAAAKLAFQPRRAVINAHSFKLR